MSKAILANRIILDVDKQLEEELKEKLTYHIPPKSHLDKPVTLKCWSRVNHTVMSIPIGREDLIPEGYNIVDNRSYVDAKFPKFKFELRPSQQDVYDEVDGNCIINAKPAYGKTFTGLAVAGKLEQKTLIVTHTTMLRDQWVQEVEKVYGFTPDIIGSGQFAVNTPIVVANVQTLTKRVLDVNRTFGTLILDECHHTPASTFINIIDKMRCAYKIGLTATLGRKDGKHVLITDYFSKHVIRPPNENSLKPKILVKKLDAQFPAGKTWADRITTLETDPWYIALIAKLADQAVEAGHKVLVICSRVSFAEALVNKCERNAVALTGETEDRDAVLASLDTTNDIICSTTGLFSEGISKNSLSCLILAAHLNNPFLLDQVVGRITRIVPGKKPPVVVDITFKGPMAKKQLSTRFGYYLEAGYEFEYI